MRRPIQIKIERLPKLKALFAAVRRFGADPSELLDIWGGVLEASTRRRFDTGRGPDGIPWIPSRRVERYGGKTLVDKGNLESSIRYQVAPGMLEVGVDGVGASSRFAYVHQFGFSGPVQVEAHTRVISQAFGIPLPGKVIVNVRGHQRVMWIPKRPFLGIDDEDRRDMREVAREHLREILGDGRP